jgi:hypothetical protein
LIRPAAQKTPVHLPTTGAKIRGTEMKINHHRTIVSTLSILLAILFAFALAHAQSGRRSTSKPAPPAPPVAAPENAPAKKPEALKLQLLVAVEDPSPFGGVPSYLSYTVLDTCIERLGDAPGVVATPTARRMNRAEAIRAAKEEKTRYTVWLQVSDELESSPQGRNTPRQLYVYYALLKPVTGKVKTSGRTQQGAHRVGNVGISIPPSRNAVYSEYEVKQSAREAAERILAAFQIKLSDGGRWPLD